MRFTACIPRSNIHARCFEEVRDSITWALTTLGHDVYRDSEIHPGTRGIIFGSRPQMLPPLPGTILYNGEQVGNEGGWPAMVSLYRSHTIWDYSEANASRYDKFSLPRPVVVRPGYSPALDGRIPKRDKTADVVFFGSMNDRRAKILDGLRDRGLKVLEVPFGVYGKERDELIAQAKLCINIHFYQAGIFEAVRCSYLAQNGVPVLTEVSVGSENAQWGIPGTPYESLVDTVVKLIREEPKQLEEIRQVQLLGAERVSLLDDLRAALAELEKPEHGAARSHDRAPITLSMIVKDEAPIIERCLTSVRPLLSHWCVVDTGSTDGTQDLVRRCLAELPGAVHDLPWKEFDGSRNDALDLARKECSDEGWLLLIDADEFIQLEGAFEVPTDGFDCYDGWVQRCIGCQRWARPLLLRANKPWFFEMPRHEGLYCRTHAPTRPTPLDGVRVLSMPDGSRSNVNAYEKFLKDAQVLEKWLLSHPGHTRCQYYIAQSYRDAATGKQPFDRAAMQQATLHYLKRADMDGFDQETFSAMYQAAKAMQMLGYPIERVQQQLLRAFNFRPSRIEPLHILSRYYREEKQYALSELFGRRAATQAAPAEIFPDFDLSVYEWRAKEELAVALTYLGAHAEARDLNRQVLACPELPAHERARIEENLQMCIRVAGP